MPLQTILKSLRVLSDLQRTRGRLQLSRWPRNRGRIESAKLLFRPRRLGRSTQTDRRAQDKKNEGRNDENLTVASLSCRNQTPRERDEPIPATLGGIADLMDGWAVCFDQEARPSQQRW
jgi:hypothetical protein